MFKEVLERYLKTVTPLKRGRVEETFKIRALQRDRLAGYSMDNLSPEAIAEYRDRRLNDVGPGTFVRDIALISSVINHARREWRVQISNPCELVRKPRTPHGRNRLLKPSEMEALRAALVPMGKRGSWLSPIVELALETAMRKSELLGLTWSNVDLDKRTAYLPMTKNGTARVVPLSSRAVDILKQLPRCESRQVFPMTVMALDQSFRRAKQRAGLQDFHFHDLRHMATTKLAEKLPNVIELAAVTGHRTVHMLKRYYHPSAELLARKLD
ncbi:site-specific integrase [Bordetella ansorpii]|nr:site-specific integrase [Bordetella ansorpii]